MNESFALEFVDAAAVIFVSNDRRNPYGIQDSACAAKNIILAAYSLGLGTRLVYGLAAVCEEPEMEVLLRE